MTRWNRLTRWLSRDPSLERARAERERTERRLYALVDADNAEWLTLVNQTLFHQGTPAANAERLVEILGRGDSYGWDEADYEVVGDRVRVHFLGTEAEVDRARLIATLERIRARLDDV